MKKIAAFITIVLLCNIAKPTYAQVQVRVNVGIPVYCPPPARVVVVRPRPLITPVVVRPVPAPAYVIVRPRPRRVIVY